MKIKQSVMIQKYDENRPEDDRFLLLYGENSWQVNGSVAAVVKLLENDLTIDELKEQIRNEVRFREDMSVEEADLIVEFLNDNGFFEGQAKSYVKKRGEWLRIVLIPGKITKQMRLFPTLFSELIFYPGLILSILWLMFMLICCSPEDFTEMLLGLTIHQLVCWLVGMAALSILHELGHVSALVHCGGNPGNIGISMNTILPRGWSETNDAWRFSRKEQMYVDVGGVYFQLLASMIFYMINETNVRSETFLVVCITSALVALINLTPNSGTDGYWLVRDAFGIKDLGKEAKAMFSRPSKEPTQKERKKKMIVAVLIVLRNMALIYLLVLILYIFRSAVAVLISEMALLPAKKRMSPAALLHILLKRPVCLIAIAVSLQNILQSARKGRKNNVS